MTGHPLEELEALSSSGGPARAELESHLEACPACRRELSWLRAERTMTARALDATDGPVTSLWAGVEAQLDPGSRQASRTPAASRAPAGFATRGPARFARWAALRSNGFATRARRRALTAFGAVAAVALLVVLVRKGSQEEAEAGLPPSAALALLHADQEYRAAILVLEARAGSRGAAPHAQARAGLSRARAAAREPAARVQLLEGYAAYLKSLRRSLDEAEE